MDAEIQLSPSDRKAVRDGLIEKLYAKEFEDLQTVSPQQVAGILDISIKTLWEITDLPRVEITTKVIRYRLTDVRSWMKRHRSPGI